MMTFTPQLGVATSLFILLIVNTSFLVEIDAQKPHPEYARINVTQANFTAASAQFWLTTLPLADGQFAMLWYNEVLHIQFYEPDLEFGYKNSTDVRTIPEVNRLTKDTRIASIRKNNVDYIALSIGFSFEVFFLTVHGRSVELKMRLYTGAIDTGVLIENDNFIVGTYSSAVNFYSLWTMSPAGVVIERQNFTFPPNFWATQPQLGFGEFYQEDSHNNHPQYSFCFYLFNMTLNDCLPGGGYKVFPQKNNYAIVGPDGAVGIFPGSFWNPVIPKLGTNFDIDAKFPELLFLTRDRANSLFVIMKEAKVTEQFRVIGFKDNPDYQAPCRVSESSVGAIYCFKNSLGCFINLYDVLEVGSEDLNFVQQIGQLDNAPSEFKAFMNNVPLYSHNVQTFPGLTWERVNQTLHLRAVNLSGLKLNGSFPNQVTQLTQLQSLDLSNNQLFGDISELNFSRMASLQFINISHNSLFGCPPVLTNQSSQCDARHNTMGCPNYVCDTSTHCSWRGAQTCQLEELLPARPSPPWYWTSLKWSKSRAGASGIYWNGLIILAGGTQESALSTVVEFYNTTDGTWGTLGKLYKGRSHASIVAIGSYLIVAGGASSQVTTVIDIYHSHNNSWTTSHFNNARGPHSAVIVDDEAWFGPTYGTTGFIEAFNPETQKWRTIEHNVMGQLAVTQYAVVASGGSIYFRETDKWVTFDSNSFAGAVAFGSSVVVYYGSSLRVLDTYSNNWNTVPSPVMLPNITSSIAVSENVLLFVDPALLGSKVCTIVMYNFTSEEWSNSTVPNAHVALSSVIPLISTDRRQTWLFGAVDNAVTVFSWKGFRPSFRSPASFHPQTDSPSASPKSNDETTIWPVFLVLGLVVMSAVLFLLWKKRKRIIGQPDDNAEDVSLLSDIEEQDEQEAPEEVASRPAEIRFEDITLGEKLGEGSYGEIFKARWHGQNVVVKMLKSKHLDQSLLIEEANTLISLRHKHIVLSMGVSKNEETNEAMLVMEYMKNGSLEDLLFRDKVTLTREEITRLALDVAKGLNYLHSLNPKIIHRDLKGANVLLYHNKKRAKISDFGTARLLNTSSAASTVIGTFGFIAPEVLQQAPYNEKADIYSFGVLLFEMVSNTHLAVIFEEEKRIERISEVVQDPEFKQLVINCCRTDPIERPSIRRCIEILKQIKAK